MGKPAVFIVAKGFEANARFNAAAEGLSNISLAVFPLSAVPLPREIEEQKLGEKVSAEAIKALTQKLPQKSETKAVLQDVLEFSGSDYAGAVASMDRYFLQHCWSDGLPLVPPTAEAVDEMLAGCDLARGDVLGRMEPGGGRVTVEKVAVNAVMAGCLPQYMPVVVAAIQAIIDPRFDLRGVQTTAGLVSPLLIVSGQKLVEELNINDDFSTLGPGWWANATIGRAVRLCMINLGDAWPGKNDMKSFGSPFKYVTLIAENETACDGAWEPLRVAEGFDRGQTTVSVMPAVSWQPDLVRPEAAIVDIIISLIADQSKVKYDRFADAWGTDNLVLISPAVFDVFHKAGLSRTDIQKLLYKKVHVPCSEFFRGKEPLTEIRVKINPALARVAEKCQANPGGLAPLVPQPENLKICVAGGYGPGMFAYVCSWGIGPSFFVTKPVKLPQNWDSLLEKHQGWRTPTSRE